MNHPQPPQMREITVTYCGQPFPIQLRTTATVLELKTVMSPLIGASVDKIIVSCTTLQRLLDMENHQLLSNAVCNIDTVIVRVKLQLWVRIVGSEIRQSVTVYGDFDARAMKGFLSKRGFGAVVMTMSLGVVDPATNEVVVIDEGIPFYNIVNPVPIVDGTELYVVV